jgi:hypothetical protein
MINKLTRCHYANCKQPVAFRVTQQNDNGTPSKVFHTCAKREHQHGCAVEGWTEPTETVVRPWTLMGFSGTFTIEPLSRLEAMHLNATVPPYSERKAMRDATLSIGRE